MRRTAALIVGGGPAGSAAAAVLAGGGARPLILERDRETGDALCGGFLSWHTLRSLAALGLDLDALGGAPIDRVRLFGGGRIAETGLPAAAVGVSRRRLDTLLQRLAERQGAGIERGLQVVDADATTVRLDDETRIGADALLLATGKHDLRGLGRPKGAAGRDPALGLRVHLGPAPALARMIGTAIELHPFDRGYAGLQMQEDGRANLCMAVHKSRLSEAGGHPAGLLAALAAESPLLADRLAFLDADPEFQAIGAVPYGWRCADTQPGLFRLGDQAGVIPSLAGEGVGIAIASGMLAGRALLANGPGGAAAFQADLRRRLRRPIWTADAVRAVAERPGFAPWMVSAMRIAPGLARIIARATRIDLRRH